MEEDGEEASRGGGSEVEEAGRTDGRRGWMKRRRRSIEAGDSFRVQTQMWELFGTQCDGCLPPRSCFCRRTTGCEQLPPSDGCWFQDFVSKEGGRSWSGTRDGDPKKR
ncbi:hypothetical protein Bca4012_049220 [Brassica carinata]